MAAPQGNTLPRFIQRYYLPSVVAVATANVNIATLNSGDVIEGVTVAEGDAVLLVGQTVPSQNGVYTIGDSVTQRDVDADASGDFKLNVLVPCADGSHYRYAGPANPTLGTTPLPFVLDPEPNTIPA